MKIRKLLSLLLVLTLVVSLFPAMLVSADEYEFWDLRNTENVSTEELSVFVDGKETAVTRYWGHYYNENEENQLTVGPGMYGPKGERDDLQINIYVPENAADDAAVMFLLNNGSWAQNGFPSDTIVDGGIYNSTAADRVSLALKYNMIVVSYGARCRGSVAIDDPAEFVGHSPATIADTKAAIRYVKYNIGLGNIPGDADKVVISGHSGGGALGSIIASTGNSSDFDEYLVNAAPATDDVFAVMASAPITDLAYADFAYEWTFKDYRADAPYDALSYDAYDEDMMALSEALAAKYVTYVKDMFGLSEEEYAAKVAEIFAASVQHELDLDAQFQYSDIRPETDDRGWFELDADGKVVSFDLDAYTAWLVQNAGVNKARYSGNELKGIMAFNSEGMKNGYNRNENNLWGTTAQRYSIAYPELWDMVADPAAIGVDQYASWDEFWAAEGALVGKQMKMVSVMPYLTGSDNMWYLEGADASGDKADIAPNWFIRHGMGDADTSYAVVASLILAVEEAAEGEVNAYFGWERNHNGGGNTYYQEFFQWMEDNGWISDDSYTFWDLRNTENVSTAEYAITVDGEPATVTHYVGHYYGEGEDNQLTVGPGMYGPKGERDDLQINIYVPDNAADDAAVMFLLNNSSWAQNGYPNNTVIDGGEYDSTGDDRVGLALKHGMIVVSYGARCRGSVAIDDPAEYVGHSPATIADTKAAIRYVKYNIGLGNIPGDADKVVISGHSGGGALGSIIAATGNSSDFDEYLVNAAPATDDVFAVLASAPITDLAYADFAYEWTFKDYRADAPYDALSYDAYGADMMALSETLAAKYVTYVEDMFGLSEEEYAAKVTEILAASVQHELDLDAQFQYSDVRPEADDRGWFELDADGKVVSFDLDAYTAWLVQNAGVNKTYAGNELKGIMAFNSEGMKNGYNRNENNLWGTTAQPYSIAYPELWDMVADPAAIGVDQYASWDEFWAAEGALVGKQMKMVSVMPYLTGSDNMWYLEGADASGDKADIAPNWFIRHGMGDADTSYAVVASLILAVEEAAEGEVNAYFGWERGHNGGGNTYYQEFFQWMDANGWLPVKEEPVVEEPVVEEPPVAEEPPVEVPEAEPQPEPVEEKGNGAVVAIVIIAVIVVAAVVVLVVKKRKAVPEKANEE